MARPGKLDETLDEAYEALYEGEIDAARRKLDDARRIDPKDRDVRLLEVDILEAEEAGEEAVTACEEILGDRKDDLVVKFRLATLLLDIYDDVPEARPHLEQLAKRLAKGDQPKIEGDDDGAAAKDFHVEVLLTLSDVRAADHDPEGALQAADEAVEKDKDDAMARLARASALFDLCRLDEAEKVLGQAIDRDSRLADAYWLRGRLLTVRGQPDDADKAFQRAVALDPERFRPPYRVAEDAFVQVMEKALEELPEPVRKYLKNVSVAVEDVPGMERLTASQPALSPGLLGLYEGTPPSLARRRRSVVAFPQPHHAVQAQHRGVRGRRGRAEGPHRQHAAARGRSLPGPGRGRPGRPGPGLKPRVDVVVVGAGHNGLVAATILAQRGLDVLVLEDQPVIGGAVRTEKPFPKAPDLPASTGAYLLGVMPPELAAITGVQIPVKRRDPHYFLPRLDGGYLLFGSDRAAMQDQFTRFFSAQDLAASDALNAEISALREDVSPTWLQEPASIEETAERFVRPALRRPFVDLCRGSIGAYLDRFGFESDLLKAMYATTDGFSGIDGGYDSPGTGMNFLVHNMCRLPGSDGTFMIVEGGMGTITTRYAAAVRRAGGSIETSAGVAKILVERGAVTGVVTKRGDTVRAATVIVNADPFRMLQMVELPDAYRAKIEAYRRPGTTMKVNLALRGLPKFTCLDEDRGQYGPTIHLLPDGDVLAKLRAGYAAVQRGELYDEPTIEWYIHTTIDPSLRDKAGHHNSALFVQWVPYAADWARETTSTVQKLLAICDRFAPGFSDLVVDVDALPPPEIERRFGMTAGHIHHVDNSFGFSDRLPYAQPIPGLYSCSAGTHPAGGVTGCSGHNAAMRVLRDLGRS
jgi:phytoene dehydrogenase-like protein/tetratricopeptide (TPR) repeat protein